MLPLATCMSFPRVYVKLARIILTLELFNNKPLVCEVLTSSCARTVTSSYKHVLYKRHRMLPLATCMSFYQKHTFCTSQTRLLHKLLSNSQHSRDRTNMFYTNAIACCRWPLACLFIKNIRFMCCNIRHRTLPLATLHVSDVPDTCLSHSLDTVGDRFTLYDVVRLVDDQPSLRMFVTQTNFVPRYVDLDSATHTLLRNLRPSKRVSTTVFFSRLPVSVSLLDRRTTLFNSVRSVRLVIRVSRQVLSARRDVLAETQSSLHTRQTVSDSRLRLRDRSDTSIGLSLRKIRFSNSRSARSFLSITRHNTVSDDPRLLLFVFHSLRMFL